MSRRPGTFADSLHLKIQLADKEGIAWNLEGLAGVAAAVGDGGRSARLFGAAAALRRAIGIPIAAPDATFYEKNLALGRSRLHPEAWTAAWAEGETLGADQAVAFALSS